MQKFPNKQVRHVPLTWFQLNFIYNWKGGKERKKEKKKEYMSESRSINLKIYLRIDHVFILNMLLIVRSKQLAFYSTFTLSVLSEKQFNLILIAWMNGDRFETITSIAIANRMSIENNVHLLFWSRWQLMTINCIKMFMIMMKYPHFDPIIKFIYTEFHFFILFKLLLIVIVININSIVTLLRISLLYIKL